MPSLRSKKYRNRLKSHAMIWVIFAPFLIMGLLLLGLAGFKVFQHLQSLSWQSVPAVLLERGVDTEKTSFGTNKIGGTSRLAGTYRYQWQGESYESDRLSFFNTRTRNVGDGLDDWDARLGKLMGQPGEPFTVWVNPQAPEQAVALRDLRWMEMGAMLGFGMLMVWSASLFLFGSDPHTTQAAFSWRAVALMGIFGLFMAVLVPLLWRDGHPIWAVVAALPLLVALHGIVHGLRLH